MFANSGVLGFHLQRSSATIDSCESGHSQESTVKFKIGCWGHSGKAEVSQQLSSWRVRRTWSLTLAEIQTISCLDHSWWSLRASYHDWYGSGKSRRDLGRDPSDQIREFKGLQAGDGWPHWPGKNFTLGDSRESKATEWLAAESLVLRNSAWVWRFQDESLRELSTEVNSRNDLSS